jgi:hypothetical protein
MRTITESSSLLAVDCWAARNHGLAVEIDKRVALKATSSDTVAVMPPWFTPAFEAWIIAVGSDPQNPLDELFILLHQEIPSEATISAWYYLHDLVDAALTRNENTQEPGPATGYIVSSAKQQRFLDKIATAWYAALKAWNMLNSKRRTEHNERYKNLLLEFVSQDFSATSIGSHEEARLGSLPVQLCEQVIEALFADIKSTRLRKLRPIHLYTVVATLETFNLIPSGLRGIAPAYLGARCQPQVKVKKGYRPDPPRGRNRVGDDTVNNTIDVLIRLRLISHHGVEGEYDWDFVKAKRTKRRSEY